MIDSVESAITHIEAVLHLAKHRGLDPELILAKIYAKHLKSDERCDTCHMYGLTFAEKFDQEMSNGVQELE